MSARAQGSAILFQRGGERVKSKHNTCAVASVGRPERQRSTLFIIGSVHRVRASTIAAIDGDALDAGALLVSSSGAVAQRGIRAARGGAEQRSVPISASPRPRQPRATPRPLAGLPASGWPVGAEGRLSSYLG